ncbi:MAG TPA: acyl-CoA dehydrogenase [Gammaproteobacteria bacterium]|nr:acyl-CoA dehydrogenase [Gammaproteobacteria bacterium]
MQWIWLVSFVLLGGMLAYHRAKRIIWALSVAIFLLLMTRIGTFSGWSLVCAWSVTLITFLMLSVTSWRHQWLTRPVFRFYCKVMPTMSRTEREALSAGTVGWEGELFRGNPHWNKLLAYPKPVLSEEEKAFLEGPVEVLCSMIDDWDITHNRADLPPEMWDYLKQQGFFALIITKEYGGKAFSAYAHSQILTKVYGKSASVGSTIAVPNSLGPAELLMHYGTVEQKNYYLPRLARGEDIPCFALTGPEAGSDAGAMSDNGIVCHGEYDGKEVLGIRLNFDKRYITLAPVATVIGLAFKLYDPDHLLGNKKDLGITCALIPRDIPGMSIGRRHFPVNVVFQNGPIHGKDVFIPVDWIIGGAKMAGQGWRMLMECLAAGRAISLPASGMGGAKLALFTTGAYARVRRQFNVPIGKFEGIEEPVARMAGYTYLMDATRSFTAAVIDTGEKPAIASAITKYHVTELGRVVCNDAMDVHGGKGICLGPRNYIGRMYESIPIAITVEGANILTRNLIIFGQGAMRCHPYVFAEFEAARNKDSDEGLLAFDKALTGHISFTISNLVRSLVLGLTSGRIAMAPSGKTKRYFQQATRLSAAFALMADLSMLVLGGSLKRREFISARLGDILSELYLLSAVLKHYHDQGKNGDDLPILRWAGLTCLYTIQQKFDELLKNFPVRWLRGLLSFLIFPLGKRFSRPSDKLTHKVAQLMMDQTPSRHRLTEGAFVTAVPGNMAAVLEDALTKTLAAEPVEKILKVAVSEGLLENGNRSTLAKQAFAKQIITQDQLDIVLQSEEARQRVIAVDDFTSEELEHATKRNKTYVDIESTRSP